MSQPQSFREFLMEGYKDQHRWRNRAANQMGSAANLDNSGQNKEHVLNVPYELRHEAKKYGATWDQDIRKWVIRGDVPDALKDMLPMKDQKIYLNVPYKDKDEAKSYGARWDGVAKKWYYAGNNPPMELSKWSME